MKRSTPLTRNIGAKVKYYRKLRGLSQKQLAAQLQTNGCDITETMLGHIETGYRSTSIFEIDKLAEALKVDYNALFAIPTLWERESEDGDDEMEERLEEGLIAALEDWNESRETEGAALARDMTSRIAQMEEWVSRIDERAPEIKEERFAVLRERLSEALAAVNGELEEGRFLQEMVVLSDKLDVSEELTRLHAHLERLRDLLEIGTDAGRRLDFTLQECFREIATCGNKIQDAQTSRLVVDFKNELEKCREQVQNLE